MNSTQQIKYIVDQIVIAYCNLKNFGDKQYEDDLDKYTSQLMDLTQLDYEGALEYACGVVSKMNECEGVA